MLKIYVARHGQDEDNAKGVLNGRRDQPLTDLGRRQAAEVAKKIEDAGLQFDAVLTSPLKRAHDTAKILADRAIPEGVRETFEIVVLDDLIERDFGIMTGAPTSSILERCGAEDVLRTEKINYFLSPKGAETFPDLIRRAGGLLADVRKRYPNGGSVLLVTHGDFGKMVYANFYGMSWEEVLRQFHFGNSDVLLLSEDSSPDKAHIFKTQQFNA